MENISKFVFEVFVLWRYRFLFVLRECVKESKLATHIFCSKHPFLSDTCFCVPIFVTLVAKARLPHSVYAYTDMH